MSRPFNTKQKDVKFFKPLRMRGPLSEKAATGKTIKEIKRHGYALIFLFDDDSFLVAYGDSCSSCGDETGVSIATRLTDLMPQQLLSAGAITREQFDAWAEESERERKSQEAIRERHQFERLKKKFEPEPPPEPEEAPRPLFAGDTP